MGDAGGGRRGRRFGNEPVNACEFIVTMANDWDGLCLIQKGLVACRMGSAGSQPSARARISNLLATIT